MSDTMDTLISASVEGTEGIQKVTGIMKNLVENSKILQDANKIIQSIATQTDLLAINAAIEATNAIHYNQGIAVLASEIRELAENCSYQGQSIGKILNCLQEKINSATAITRQSLEEFTKITELVDKVRRHEQKISEVTGEVRERARKITASSSLILTGVTDLETETAEMSKAINDLMGVIEYVKTVTLRISDGFMK